MLLNRRLAGDVYDGVARLALTADGRLAIDGAGATIDWLVVMRRLPHDRMLDRMIAAGSFEFRHLERLGRRLATFYAGRAAREDGRPTTYLDRFRSDQADNRAVLAACRDGCRRTAMRDFSTGWPPHSLEKGPLLEERARAGRIVDGHGDLRPQHVCMTETLVIFDCLEFSDALRQVDPVDEIAFLGMECAILGADWIGPKLMADRSGAARPNRFRRAACALHGLPRAAADAALARPSARSGAEGAGAMAAGCGPLCRCGRRGAEKAGFLRRSGCAGRGSHHKPAKNCLEEKRGCR